MSRVTVPLSFNERAQQMLACIEYRRAVTEQERDAIFRQRHDGYMRENGIDAIPSGRFTDPWDDAPNADIIGVYLDGRLAASVRIHVSDSQGGLPACEPYSDVVQPYLERGLRLVDATRFVVDHRHAVFSSEMPFLTLRAVAMAAEHYRSFGLLAAVRREHTIVYTRVTGHRTLTGPRPYPLLRRPLICMFVETTSLDRSTYFKHPFLRSTQEERERIFGATPAAMRLHAFSPSPAPSAAL